ncbi:MAG: hypothetical protein E6Z15_10490, partial [Paenibacillus macerans]|nr:hypothetical protein [Paenibacillus macerans]
MEQLILLSEILIINLVLSGDNAVVIAMASKSLPLQQRKQAVWWGALGAVLLRCALTWIAVILLKIPFIHAAGGLLLAGIAFKLLLPAPQGNVLKQTVYQALSSGSCRVAVIAAANGPVKRKHLEVRPVLRAGAGGMMTAGAADVRPDLAEVTEWLETDASARGLGASLAAGVRQLSARHSMQAILV